MVCAFWLVKRAWRHSGVSVFNIGTSKKLSENAMFCTFWLGNVLRATAACNFSTSELQTVLFLTFWKCASQFFSSTCELRPFFNILTCKYASRHSGVPVSNIGTSKNGPRMRCFVHFDPFFDIGTSKSGGRMVCRAVHFDLEKCFEPQRCAIFDICSEHVSLHPSL